MGEGDVILFFAESRPKDVWISLEQVAKLKNLDPNFHIRTDDDKRLSALQNSFPTERLIAC